jgi:hypothetical protein
MKQTVLVASQPPETDFVGEFIANYVPTAANKVVLKEVTD